MEFPFGHQHHRHHNNREEEEEREEQGYPPPGQRSDRYSRREERYPEEGEEYQRPPSYRRQEEESYYGENIYERPPPPSNLGYESGSSYPPVQHVAHEVNLGPYSSSGYGREEYGAPPRRTVRVFTKAKHNYSLTIRDDTVVLAAADPNDEYQHWIKDEKYSTKVKDEEEFPSFALVNKVTGQAIKHSIGAQHPIRLVPYNPDYLDESILWTESSDVGDGFRCIRMVNNIGLNFDAFHGDPDHGGVHDGTTVVLWEWLEGENQRWKIVPYCKFLPYQQIHIKGMKKRREGETENTERAALRRGN